MRDKNSVIGIMLMVLLTVLYFMFAPKPEPSKQEVANNDSDRTEQVDRSSPTNTTETPVADETETDSVKAAIYGDFGPLMNGEEKLITINTDKLEVTINSLGGQIVEAKLKDYKTFDSLPLPIISKELEHELYFEFVNKKTSQQVKSSELFFSPSEPGGFTLTGEDSKELVMTAQLADGRHLRQVYTFSGDSYDVGYSIKMKGMKPYLKNRYYEIKWNAEVPKTEQAIKLQRQKTQVVYMQGDDLERMGGMTDEDDEEQVKGDVDWISYKSQFFSHALIAKSEGMRSPRLAMTTPEESAEVVKEMHADFQVDLTANEENSNDFLMYMGPNEYKTLRSYKVGLNKQMDLGYLFISQINIGTIYIFKFFEKYISNYGLIILIFAILIKLIVFPLTYKSYVSMAKLRVLNQTPEMKGLDEKFKDDPQKQQMEKMAIYRKMGVSPLGGCLPMLLQWPILISMFFFFPQSVELRQKSFLWAHDLSTYDSILELGFTIPGYGDHVSLFTILMAISIYIYTYFQQKSQPTNTAMPFMKYLPYIFPIIFVVFLNNYASGLSWYYFAANIISIIQTTSIRASLNDEKLLAEMRENFKKGGKKKGNSKKSKGRLEGWVERQQKKQEAMARDRQSAQRGNKNRNTRRKK